MVSERHRTYATAAVMDAGNGEDEFDDPLYLHITENPNLILVSPPLSECNYASWSRSMKIALGVKNKFGFVNGDIPNPGEGDIKYAIWKRCNDILCSWILKSLNSTIAESVLYFEFVKYIWKALKKRYSQADPHRIAEIQNEIFKNMQGNMTINEYFTKCNALWEQLNAMRPMPICECLPRCSCSLMSKIKKDREDDQVIRFLEGLNDEFETIKSGVLVMDPIPAMKKVLNMALKLERKLNGSVSHRNNEIIQSNAVQNSSTQSIDDQNIVVVSASYNKKRFNNNGGRIVLTHGYPPGWVAGYKSKNKQGQDNQQTVSGSVNQVGDIGLSADQFQRLISLLQNQNQGHQASTSAAVTINKSGIKSDFKNLPKESQEDLGATDHITCSLEYFERYHKTHDISVQLPNGKSSVEVTHIGDIRLHSNLLLKNGPYGIISGFAEEKGGLYLLKDPPYKKRSSAA
ncbi:PREDICTED: uncharacterized protein LOC109150164 [Ipomoea nil]|uniref:uncharacterized protein LOC109150164 n=1 Tax=Ipomoea nil TaxID=35883 RepID=UPI00090198D2|nr:PREDICTED: uncharacterized protein LOC109150164 [Ipomoea nil]